MFLAYKNLKLLDIFMLIKLFFSKIWWNKSLNVGNKKLLLLIASVSLCSSLNLNFDSSLGYFSNDFQYLLYIISCDFKIGFLKRKLY